MWSFSDPREADEDEDLVGIGADLLPGTLLAAYRRGIFPMPDGGVRPPMCWFSPVRRGVIPLDGLVVSRSLRRAVRSCEIRVDTAFVEVVTACADPRRPQGWITTDIAEAYVELHRLGWAHSVEAWRDGRLVGGLYGVAIGGLFAGSRCSTASGTRPRSRWSDSSSLMSDEHAASRLLDVQWVTPHLATLGAVEIPRDDYLDRLEVALDVPPPRWPQTTSAG